MPLISQPCSSAAQIAEPVVNHRTLPVPRALVELSIWSVQNGDSLYISNTNYAKKWDHIVEPSHKRKIPVQQKQKSTFKLHISGSHGKAIISTLDKSSS